jgi:hypothetical protein
MPKHHDAPDLTGLGEYGFDFSQWPVHSLDTDFAKWTPELRLAVGFLEKIRSVLGECGLAAGVSSYTLKHVYEVWCLARGANLYLPNGVMIGAAVCLDLPMRREADSPNCTIGLSEARLLRAKERWHRLVSGDARQPYTRCDATDKALDATLEVEA